MRSVVTSIAVVLVAAFLLSACSVLRPDRTLHSTMLLAPGQTVVGTFTFPDGSRGLVQFQRQAPRGSPDGPQTWSSDGKIEIALPGTPFSQEPSELGYLHRWLEDGLVMQAIVSNPTNEPVSFDWSVTGPGRTSANWDVSGTTRSE